MKELKKGDVVWLKSNKLILMTIKFIQPSFAGSKELEACCQWFDGKLLKEGCFPIESLDKKDE
jgi:uncharacterized protein YodC (DUF2158 family)